MRVCSDLYMLCVYNMCVASGEYRDKLVFCADTTVCGRHIIYTHVRVYAHINVCYTLCDDNKTSTITIREHIYYINNMRSSVVV